MPTNDTCYYDMEGTCNWDGMCEHRAPITRICEAPDELFLTLEDYLQEKQVRLSTQTAKKEVS